MGSYEWIILEVGFLGLLVWELVRTRRAISKARTDAAAAPVAPHPTPSPGEGVG